MEIFLQAETVVVELLLMASIVAIVVRRLRIPYTVALVLVGLLFTFQESPFGHFAPELILVIFVPPLVFEAAFHLNLDQLRRNWLPILTLAVPGVLWTMFVVGGIVGYGVGIALPSALLFGALIAATDPVAVVSIFKSLGAPRSLSVLVEGESLFNDGTAIVVFNLMIAIVLTGQFNLVNSLQNFVVVSAGGIGIGLFLGWVVSRIIAAVDDYLIETTLTTVLAFGSYLVAERLHVSGVLAVVTAGLLCGNLGPRGMSPTTKIVLFNFWEYLAFVANSVVFLLIGLEIDLPQLVQNWRSIGIAIAAVLISRLVVYLIATLLDRDGRSIPMAYRHVMFWGGLRGAISLALVLSLPMAVTDRDQLRVMAFGVVLFTLLVQGTTIQFLLQRLGLVHISEEQLAYERTRGHLLAVRAARDSLGRLHGRGMIAPTVWETVSDETEQAEATYRDQIRALLQNHPDLAQEEAESVRREGLRAQRSTIAELQRDGVLSEKVYEEMVSMIDAELASDHPQLIGVTVQNATAEGDETRNV